MTYHCGLSFPGTRRDPGITCDGCGMMHPVAKPSGMPLAWFLDGKAPKGWAMYRSESGDGLYRRDYCPRCKPIIPPIWPDACPCGGDVAIDGVEDLSPGRCLSCGRAHRLRTTDRPGHSPWVEVVP
jgi:hypothetical protein